jgi:hypothetical protein
MADITKSTICALAVTWKAARAAERAGWAQLLAGKIGEAGYRELVAAVDAADLALATELGTYAGATFATLSTNLSNATQNDLKFTAVRTGDSGTAISMQYVDPGEETAAESVSVTGSAIIVTLRSVSNVLSTAAEVKTALDAAPAVAAFITTAFKTGNDGSGVVAALAHTHLA